MTSIRFKARLLMSGTDAKSSPGCLITLPRSASAQLSSRGTAVVEGTINGAGFRAALEPDGQGSHWFIVNEDMREAAGAGPGDEVMLKMHQVKEWPEPDIPSDLKKALASDPRAHALWKDITPMARWEWIRWMDSVRQTETRRARPDKLRSMLKSGKRRPCCFNRGMRTPPKRASLLKSLSIPRRHAKGVAS